MWFPRAKEGNRGMPRGKIKYIFSNNLEEGGGLSMLLSGVRRCGVVVSGNGVEVVRVGNSNFVLGSLGSNIVIYDQDFLRPQFISHSYTSHIYAFTQGMHLSIHEHKEGPFTCVHS